MFRDRTDAGRQLAAWFTVQEPADPVVLALPRGGVPVAFEIARELRAPLDVHLVRKIGAPLQPELGVGAIADGVLSTGYRSNSANFKGIVNQALIKDKRFGQAERGVYQLTKKS